MYQRIVILFVILSSVRASNNYEGFLSPPKYHNYTELMSLFRYLERKFPQMAKVLTIGQSVRQRDLLVIQIHGDVYNIEPLTPKFKYVANIYGDEAVGRQLIVYLAQYLLFNYGKLPRITRLVDTTDIYLMPSLNPDGFQNADEGECDDSDGKYNEEEVDLNINFPNGITGQPDFNLLQVETQAMMDWLSSTHFLLSGNLQGGALRYTFPFSLKTNNTDGEISDDAIFKDLGYLYARKYPGTMGTEACGSRHDAETMTGKLGKKKKLAVRDYKDSYGMHNYNYYGFDCIELIFFVSCCNYPFPQELEFEWTKHKESLITYISGVHWGVKGMVLNDMGQPIPNATIKIMGMSREVKTTNRGAYWRILQPGNYKISASASGYKKRSAIISVTNEEVTLKSFILSIPSRTSINDTEEATFTRKARTKIRLVNRAWRGTRLRVHLLSLPSIIYIFVTHWSP